MNDNKLPKRKHLRVKEYDYSSCGANFVTICTSNRKKLLSSIQADRRSDPCGRPHIELFRLGEIAEEAIQYVENLYGVKIDCHVIIPDHVHMIVILPDASWSEVPAERSTARVAPTDNVELGRVVGAYKSIVSTRWLKICRENNQTMGKLWQRGYMEHIIRNKDELSEIRHYIFHNPEKWYYEHIFNES